MSIAKRGVLSLTVGLGLMLGGWALASGEETAPTKKEEAAEAKPKLLPWHPSLSVGIQEARKRKVGIVVKVGAEWCGWCHKLDAEIEHPEVQAELAKWVLVRLDADEDAEDVRKLSVGPIPALRILDVSGRPTRSQDGFLTADEFIAWLLDRSAPVDESLALEEVGTRSLSQVVQLLGHRDAKIREAARQRLIPEKSAAGPQVAHAFTRGTLAVRLATLELLTNWKAPVQDLDPWRPETITVARLNHLEGWIEQLEAALPREDRPLEVPISPE